MQPSETLTARHRCFVTVNTLTVSRALSRKGAETAARDAARARPDAVVEVLRVNVNAHRDAGTVIMRIAPSPSPSPSGVVRTLDVPCGDGVSRTVAVRVDLGVLAVHPPASGTKRGRWTITHKPTLRAAGTFTGKLADARALAVLWDGAFAAVDWTAKRRQPWPLMQTWRAQCWGDAPITGPTLPQPSPNAHPARPETVQFALDARRSVRTFDGNTWQMQWRGKWWPMPTMAELESWTLDSVCETPDGRTVEHDAPDAWLRLLALV
jgi:hypothetical protein